MADAKTPPRDTLPKSGRVNEVCREWLVREDGALAHRLQNKEIEEHCSSNRNRNAQIREDFPCALDEQIREQKMAEHAAALYHQMITEQEEIDAQIAKELADKIERDERAKRRVLELEDQRLAAEMLQKERSKNSDRQTTRPPNHLVQHSPQRQTLPSAYPPPELYPPKRPDLPQQYYNGSGTDPPRRQALPMALPSPKVNNSAYLDNAPIPPRSNNHTSQNNHPIKQAQQQHLYQMRRSPPENILHQFTRCNLEDIDDRLELGLPVDEVEERRLQEEKDAELARQLQEEEGNSEESQVIRDRMLAIEAQDKELAKLLQERERSKARRAKERAKQKALAKKQQMEQQQQNIDEILPDDSYSNPVDVLQQSDSPHHSFNQYSSHSQQRYQQHGNAALMHQNYQQEDDANYSYPVDVVPPRNAQEFNKNSPYQSPQKSNHFNPRSEIRMVNGMNYPSSSGGGNFNGELQGHPPHNLDLNYLQPVRPTQLDLKGPMSRPAKPKYPEPETIGPNSLPTSTNGNMSTESPASHVNIAMAIDPTYPRRGAAYQQSPLSHDISSSTVTTSTSTSSSSPGISLPPPEISDFEEEAAGSPVPPYMPIQGQRRTASLEKKVKKSKAKDGCKQQ